MRFSPSFVSYDRCLSRPVATTREPLVREPATCSANSRQQDARRKSASPSFQSFAARSKVRGVDAIVKFATANPPCV